MAAKGSIRTETFTGDLQGCYFILDWEQRFNAADNYSTVYFQPKIYTPRKITLETISMYITFDPVTQPDWAPIGTRTPGINYRILTKEFSTSGSGTFNIGGEKPLAETKYGTTPLKIYHNLDGSPFTTITGDLSDEGSLLPGDNGVSISVSSSSIERARWQDDTLTIDLEAIDKVASIKCPDAFVGDEVVIIIDKKGVKDAKYRITYEFGTLRGVVVSNTVDSSVSWLIPAGFVNQFPSNVWHKTCKLTIETILNDKVIGSNSTQFTVRLDPNQKAPTFSPEVQDISEKTLNLTGNANTLVKYFSNALVLINAQGQDGATIVEQSVTCGGKGFSGKNDGVIENVESGLFQFRAIDSRGAAGSASINKVLIPYAKLTCNLTANRLTTDGELVYTIEGNFFNKSFGMVDNALVCMFRYKSEDGVYSSWSSVFPTFNGDTYKYEGLIEGLDYLKTYTIQAKVYDKLMEITSAEMSITSRPVYDWGRDDFNFNVPVNMPSLSIGGKEINNLGTNNVLWSGVSHMNGNQTIQLAQAISEQVTGAVLVFSAYDNAASAAKDVSWSTHFIPKEMINISNSGGQLFMMANNAGFSTFAGKYLYISDDDIGGHATNTNKGTNASGITFDNSLFVLRAVIGI